MFKLILTLSLSLSFGAFAKENEMKCKKLYATISIANMVKHDLETSRYVRAPLNLMLVSIAHINKEINNLEFEDNTLTLELLRLNVDNLKWIRRNNGINRKIPVSEGMKRIYKIKDITSEIYYKACF